MTKTFAHQAAPIALAALLTTAMLLATNALAGHQYRVAALSRHAVQHGRAAGFRVLGRGVRRGGGGRRGRAPVQGGGLLPSPPTLGCPTRHCL